MMMRTLEADFNQIADDDTIWISLRRIGFVPAGELGVGSVVELRDADGDSCWGRIVRIDERSVNVELDEPTWKDAVTTTLPDVVSTLHASLADAPDLV